MSTEIEMKEEGNNKMVGADVKTKSVPNKKRGRKPKNHKEEYNLNEDQSKFFVDLSKEKEVLEQLFNLLKEANNKTYGREITFKDLALFGIEKITPKDIEKIQDNSLSSMEKVEKALDEYNKKNSTNLALGEFLVKKLSIN